MADQEMKSLYLTEYTKPNAFHISSFPKPQINGPHDVLIKVHAASINPIDVKLASGMMASISQLPFPYKIGYDLSGIVEGAGSSVTNFKQGDAVFTRLPDEDRGSVSEYALTKDAYLAMKPSNASHIEAASIPLVSLAAFQSLQRASNVIKNGVVFVPAGLSGTGSIACQLAKNYFGAKKIITTVSTNKVDQVPRLLGEGIVDQIIDYKTTNPTDVIPRGSVDFLFDTTAQGVAFMALLKPKTGRIVTISAIPSGDTAKAGFAPDIPVYLKIPFDMIWNYALCWAWWFGVGYEYAFMEPKAKDLETMAKLIEDGKVRPVVGRTAKLSDLQAVRELCDEVYTGKGGIGKSVITID